MKPISFSVIGRFVGIAGNKINRWYKEVLSGFVTEEVQAELHQFDTVDPKITDKETGEMKTVAVPILKPENFGEDMAIDDKNIGGDGYTVISNKVTGKIAAMLQTVKSNIIEQVLSKVPVSCLMAVKTISKDLAGGYDWIARNCFMNAQRIADKFHVLKLGFEALQDIRIRYRQEALTVERERIQAHKATEREKRELAKQNGKSYKMEKAPPAKKYSNNDTKKELLARSRYLLFKFPKEWTEVQQERASILFREYPEIKIAHDLITEFRLFYKAKVGEKDKAKEKLKSWYKTISKRDIEELNNFSFTIKKHESEILNYFEDGHTNAYAESLNSQIQQFVNTNSGTKDRDFFHFRIKLYFS
jgi:transposase